MTGSFLDSLHRQHDMRGARAIVINPVVSDHELIVGEVVFGAAIGVGLALFTSVSMRPNLARSQDRRGRQLAWRSASCRRTWTESSRRSRHWSQSACHFGPAPTLQKQADLRGFVDEPVAEVV